jgi:hypothetical protein
LGVEEQTFNISHLLKNPGQLAGVRMISECISKTENEHSRKQRNLGRKLSTAPAVYGFNYLVVGNSQISKLLMTKLSGIAQLQIP